MNKVINLKKNCQELLDQLDSVFALRIPSMEISRIKKVKYKADSSIFLHSSLRQWKKSWLLCKQFGNDYKIFYSKSNVAKQLNIWCRPLFIHAMGRSEQIVDILAFFYPEPKYLVPNKWI